MTQVNVQPETKTGDNRHVEDDHGLEEKMRDYHERGGPHGGDTAKTVEGEITSATITSDEELKKGRPPAPSRRGE